MKRFYTYCLLLVFANTCIAMQNDLEVIRDCVRKPIQSSEVLAPVADLINYLLEDQNTKLYKFIKEKYIEDRNFKQPFKNYSYEDVLCNMVLDERFCNGIFQKYLQQDNLCALLLAYLYYELFVFQDILGGEDRVLEYLSKKEYRGFTNFTEREMIFNLLEKLETLIHEDCENLCLEELILGRVMYFKNQLIQSWSSRLTCLGIRNAPVAKNNGRGRVSNLYSDFCDSSWVLRAGQQMRSFYQK
jgi:hypothetical protein